MSQFLVSGNATDDLDPSTGWGEVPLKDRPLWSRYMVDHLPWFPGVTLMARMAPGVMNGGTRAPRVWKQTAEELHKAGFTPADYYLLAELLMSADVQAELDEAEHGHLFHRWFDARRKFTTFRLAAEAWKPWLERLADGESPQRALEHILKGDVLPPLGSITAVSTGEVTRVSND